VNYRDNDATAPDRLARFVAAMDAELDANADKGDWRTTSPLDGLAEIAKHLAKLTRAVAAGDRGAILEHAADVANTAFILADVAGALAPPVTSLAARTIYGGDDGY
jgi:hypothetical protein